jgi:hypothetical protein
LPPLEEGQIKRPKEKPRDEKLNEDLFTTSVSRKKEGKKNADFVLYTRDECAVVCEFCVFYLYENVSASTKKRKKNNSIHLGPFLPLTA